ncbi:hypothetical protein TUM17383_28870 [Shewanella algae]|nr:hypothetical protein TUM17383_28870 [Shewanella algae]
MIRTGDRKRPGSQQGAGNFRNMFINIPDGKEKGNQVIPIGDFSSKDQFASAKNISA